MLRWSGRSGKLRPTIDEKMVPLIVMKGCQRIFCKQVGHINAVSVPYSLVNINKIYTFFVQVFLRFFYVFWVEKFKITILWYIHYEKAQKVDWNYLIISTFFHSFHMGEKSQCSCLNPHITDTAVSEREMPGSLFAR